MAILSTRQAVRLGRLGGKVSAVDRKGNREWGRKAQRRRAAKAQKQHYPELSKEWARNANRARWGRPLKPLPQVGSRWTRVAPTQYQRECPGCRQTWTSSRCPHDREQEPCPFCHRAPAPLRVLVIGGCECQPDV